METVNGMKIKSKHVSVEKPISEIFIFLKDTRNIYHLLPEDKISDWKADELSCSFKVQGGIMIPFQQTGLEEPTRIYLKSGERAPFKFDLTIFLEEKDGKTEGYLLFDADVNMFLKMMIESPLENLFNMMADKMKSHFED